MEIVSWVAFAGIYVFVLVIFLAYTGPLFIASGGFSLADWKENSSGQKALGATLMIIGLVLLAANGPILYAHVSGQTPGHVTPVSWLYDFLFTSKSHPSG